MDRQSRRHHRKELSISSALAPPAINDTSQPQRLVPAGELYSDLALNPAQAGREEHMCWIDHFFRVLRFKKYEVPIEPENSKVVAIGTAAANWAADAAL